MENSESNKKMTDEERLVLAEKLDKELDEFIDGLENRKYTDGWSEDTWREEMDKHPFFMKHLPENPTDELHPLMEGLQKLKYDPEETTAEELASNYRDDGNFYVKHKKYRMAVMSYTEAIKIKCQNNELNAILYNNRSAAQFFLKNYRSSLMDAKKAYELKPDYMKPKLRASQCAYALNKFELCMQICDEILQEEYDSKQAIDLRKDCVTKKTTKERDERRLALDEKKREEALVRLLDTLKSRNIRFENVSLINLSEKWIRPKLAPLVDFPVSLSKDGSLLWPTVFCYPEFLTTDFQQQLDENVVLADCLDDMFREPLSYDTQCKYSLKNLHIYYENRVTAKVHLIDTSKTIRDIIEQKFFNIIDGCLMFYILAKNSTSEREFLEQTRIPIHEQN